MNLKKKKFGLNLGYEKVKGLYNLGLFGGLEDSQNSEKIMHAAVVRIKDLG